MRTTGIIMQIVYFQKSWRNK